MVWMTSRGHCRELAAHLGHLRSAFSVAEAEEVLQEVAQVAEIASTQRITWRQHGQYSPEQKGGLIERCALPRPLPMDGQGRRQLPLPPNPLGICGICYRDSLAPHMDKLLQHAKIPRVLIQSAQGHG